MFTRYAIYYTPEPGTPLAEFGANWLGWDSAAGAARGHPQVEGLDIAQITATPRKYGFHGTIKPPFRLAEGVTPEALDHAVAALARRMTGVTAAPLVLRRLGRFYALVLSEPSEALAALAAAC
ncbi:MAG: DUF1045 domain-containing protein, partial [Pseudomonadota bacterium]